MKLAVLAAALCAVSVARAQTIVDIVKGDPDLTLLLDAVIAGGLAETLSGPGPFTVFAPINQAFEALGDDVLDYVLNQHNVQDLDNVLTYHAVSGAVYSNQLKDGQIIPTLDNKLTATAHVQGQDIHINQARVIKADIKATNGVVHIVDGVLVPSNFAYPKADIVTTAAGVSTLSTLVTAVKTAGLVDALTYPHGPYTVFAPNNQAFAELPPGVLNYLLQHPQELAAIILYHVVDFRGDFDRGARIYSEEIANDEIVFTLNGQPLVFVVNGNAVLVNGNATVVAANVDTSNGVVHVINQVLIPNAQGLYARAAAWNAQKKSVRGSAGALPNLVQLAESVPQLSTLVTAVQAAGLVNVLSTTSPLTVFAPTNDAFAKLPDQYLAYLLKNITALTAVLTNHVVAGNYTAGTLKNGEVLPTLDAPHNVTVTIDRRGGVFIDYAQVIAANNMASNGVAHIVDEVILPVGF